MLRIRLRRVGKKGKPSYRIVVAEATAPRDGDYLDWIGNYDPMTEPPAMSIKQDRAVKWLSQGAQPSDAVRRILDKTGILERAPATRSEASKPSAVIVEEPASDESAGQAAGEEAPAGQPPKDDGSGGAPADDGPGGAPADDGPGEAPEE